MGEFCSWWHPVHSVAAPPRPLGPRTTFGSWVFPSSPCNGASPGIWQFWQRGCCNTERTTSNARSAPSDGGDCCAITSLSNHAPKASVAARTARMDMATVFGHVGLMEFSQLRERARQVAQCLARILFNRGTVRHDDPLERFDLGTLQ